MIKNVSPNTQAILLLTAPLIAGRNTPSYELLTPSKYKQLAQHLRALNKQPSDLLEPDAAELLHECHHVIDEMQLQRLLGRGFLLSQAIEQWQKRAIWVISRADTEYPRLLKIRLREDAPAVLYGCGDESLLETRGLAVVGSRQVNDALIEYTQAIGELVAHAGRTLISGGAKGVDQAAMRGALEAGGIVNEVLADSLEKTVMNRDHRDWLLDGRLMLISPYDPNSGFNIGNAMQRNKLIYALADAALVVQSDVNKGGTWAGAIEQLDKFRCVPVYIRSTGESSDGLNALHKKGANPWPNPQDADALDAIFGAAPSIAATSSQLDLAPVLNDEQITVPLKPSETTSIVESTALPASVLNEAHSTSDQSDPEIPSAITQIALTPADRLFEVVKNEIQQLLIKDSIKPMKEAEIAAALDVSNTQTRKWLKRLIDEDLIEKQKKPVRYVLKQSILFK